MKSRRPAAGLRAVLGEQKILLIILGIVAVLAFVRPMFVSSENLFNILFQVSITSIIGIGMTFLMIGADFDLSVGSNMVFATTVAILLEALGSGLNLAAAVLAATLAGFVNGVLVAKLKINSFITTLSMMFFLRGLVLIFTNKKTISGSEHTLFDFGYGSLFGLIPYPVLAAAVLLVAFGLMLSRTVLGRNLYALGSNEKAARMFGIDVAGLKIFAFSLTGFLCGLSGIVLLSRLNSASGTYGMDTALDVISGVLLGGVSLSGGEGSVFKAFQGILLLGVLSNAMIALHITPYLQQVIKGLLLVAVVSLDSYQAKKAEYR
jgi:ribose/xylose/arabinose/galactoside ABC-type transport system permease subunit